MNPFVRFIFAILAAGIAVNLSVVFLANAQSQSRQRRQDRENEADLAQAFQDKFDKRLRRTDIVVESQRVDHDGTAQESTLLLRQYLSSGADQSRPLLVQRVVIPGDRLAVYGVVIEFNSDFAGDAPEFQFLRGAEVAYFSFVCGENEKPAPNQPDDRFTFMPRSEVPEHTRLDIASIHPTIFEVNLWKYIWNRIPDEQHPVPWSTNPAGTPPKDWKDNLNVTFLKPITINIRLKHTYSAWIRPVDTGATFFIEEDAAGMPELIGFMIAQIKYQEAQTRPAPAPATATSNPQSLIPRQFTPAISALQSPDGQIR